jgi:Integrase zinc binding domain
MRLGGRLRNSSLPYDQKHPIFLKKGYFLTLIIRDAHQRTLHGGVELTTGIIRQNYWSVNLKRCVTNELTECMTCKKHKQKLTQQIMGDLPEQRSRPSRPFTHTGVDYAGPITLRMGVRGQKMIKGYIAIFICMATKAIHIEMVSDLTSKAFIAAFKRFVGRRGSSSKMYSDNGTNFVGADKLLKDEIKLIHSTKAEAENMLAAEGISWQFNPPGAPNIGGLWEAGVKSIKSHLKKAIGETALSFEEMATVLIQIEACLNSRPLYPIT